MRAFGSKYLLSLLVLAGVYLFAIHPDILDNPSNADGIAPPTDIELLGTKIFDDTSLSEPPGQGCISCHDPKKGRQGNNNSPIAAMALGSRPAIFGDRNTPTTMYSHYSPPFSFVAEKDESGRTTYVPVGGLFWDGRAATMTEQVVGPLLNPLEMNNVSEAAVIAKVKASGYAPLARKVFGEKIFDDPRVAMAKISEAVVAYEKTLEFAPFASRFDGYLRGKVSLKKIEQKGFELFKDSQKGNCIACHVGNVNSNKPEDWLFTDFSYDVLGAPRNATIPVNADARYYDLGLCKQPGIEKKVPSGFDVNSLCGAFKVPTLRNVAITAPYFHNGSVASLRDAVKFYVTRDTNPELWFPKLPDGSVSKYNDLPAAYHRNVSTAEVPYDRKPGEAPRLNDEEIDAIVAFLKTLTDPAVE